ncbi:MAG: 2,3,4,5-tetrahydropyridine-2,6-dicarboxylate N-succinyltransferase [Acidobacteria bacterium]|nr:2,3,4,5-tetrahydropyridine-2,6-dicarboxylate N-succinyltransferase [Acidobacteriota bacterium]
MTASAEDLKDFFEREPQLILEDPDYPDVHRRLLAALERGEIRAAEPDQQGVWQVCAWVKQAILYGFRSGRIERIQGNPAPFFDKDTYPIRWFSSRDHVRLVPGGSAVRRGAYVAPGVVIMPPAYINVGAYVGANSMIDSHALVGSCAQIGSEVHVSAGAQIGGVLEPAGARPVIVEDQAFVGGLVGLFEGVRVRRRAVLAAGVVVTRATPILDLVKDCEYRGEIPENAVVIAGSRPVTSNQSTIQAHINAAVIVKYRDQRTDAAVALEDALRSQVPAGL